MNFFRGISQGFSNFYGKTVFRSNSLWLTMMLRSNHNNLFLKNLKRVAANFCNFTKERTSLQIFFSRNFEWYANQQVMSCELQVNNLTGCVYCTSCELRAIFVTRVKSYFLYKSSKLLLIARVTSYKLLFIAGITSYCLLHNLLVAFCMRVTSYCLIHELRVNF